LRSGPPDGASATSRTLPTPAACRPTRRFRMTAHHSRALHCALLVVILGVSTRALADVDDGELSKLQGAGIAVETATETTTGTLEYAWSATLVWTGVLQVASGLIATGLLAYGDQGLVGINLVPLATGAISIAVGAGLQSSGSADFGVE